MSKWGPSNWVMFELTVALFSSSVLFVAAGVITHDEPGFIDENSMWDHVPITVTCRYESIDGCGSVEDAVKSVNSRIGFHVLMFDGDRTGGDIVVTTGSAVNVGGNDRDSAGGHFILMGRDGVYMRCMVWTANVTGPNDLEWLTAYHELGHCIGLDHDDYDMSIMRPIQAPTVDGELPPWISDHDRDIIRARYVGTAAGSS